MIRMVSSSPTCPVVFLFDYGGVLAEEGFTEGLKAIAFKNGIDQDDFF